MKGLELSEAYYRMVGAPMIARRFPAYQDDIAVGLVGDGSECFGYDDEFSRDHDWGPGFCLWLNGQTFSAIGEALLVEYNHLRGEFGGFIRQASQWGEGRVGVFEIGAFYKGFIGFDHVPATPKEWRAIPESYLAVATNGRVFRDIAGEFSAFRESLKAYYPEDVRLKKLASRCMNIAQMGQYNFPRCIRRGEYVAAQYAEAQFINYAISLIYLLNREYKPFFKWMHRDMQRLPVLGQPARLLLQALVTAQQSASAETVGKRKIQLIEEISQLIIAQLRQSGLSDSPSDYLADHGPLIQAKIQDPEMRALNVWLE